MTMAEILLVSGSWQVRILLKAELEEHGHCVHALDSLADGLEYLRQRPWPPDLILVDTTQLLLSDDDLRELEKAAGGVPILLSVGPTDLARADLKPGRGIRVLRRPLMVREVVDRVERTLERAAG
jgi:DNA-binding response OmpR family regulator